MNSLLLGATGLERQFSRYEMMLTIKILVRGGGGGGCYTQILKVKFPGGGG